MKSGVAIDEIVHVGFAGGGPGGEIIAVDLTLNVEIKEGVFAELDTLEFFFGLASRSDEGIKGRERKSGCELVIY